MCLMLLKKIRRVSAFRQLFLVFLFGLYFVNSASANIVFDLGGVLVDPQNTAIFRHTGIYRFIRYLLVARKNPKELLFRVLNEIKLPYGFSNVEREACDHAGHPLPRGLIYWLKGIISSCDIISFTDDLLQNNPDYSALEKDFMSNMIRTVFDPDLFSQTRIIYDEGIAFVIDCINQGHKVYILSNFDKDSWYELKQMLPEFFDCFDGAVISSEVGRIKPDPALFSLLLENYDLDPAETVFIDDQKENLSAAQKLGIYPIQCKKAGWFFNKVPDFDAVRAEFESWQKNETCANQGMNDTILN